MADLPLAGLKVLVTRPRDQALHLAEMIEKAGGIPMLFPLLGIEPVRDGVTLQQQLLRLPGARLAIFISPNAVQYGMAAIRGSSGLPPGLKVATVGPGSAQALRESGVGEVLVPDGRFDSEGLLEKLQDVAGWRVMIFRGDGGRELLGDTLRARGAEVEYVTCYHRVKARPDVGELSGAQALTVTSSEALDHLSQMEGVREALYDKPLFVPHPRIAELARKLGWNQVRQTDTGDEGLLSGLMEWQRVGMSLYKGSE